MLKIGDKAPTFELKGYLKDKFKDYSFKDFKNKWVILFFYPSDFTFVCPTEISGLNDRIEDFRKLGAEIIGISVDSIFAYKKWVEDLGGLDFPLLSDFHKRVSRDYHVLDEETGTAMRGLFIIDPFGTIKHIVLSDENVGRSVDETIRVLAALQTGKLCPVDWKPGESTLS